MTNQISDKDKKDWENFLSSEEKLPDKDLKLKKKKYNNTYSIDLHGYTLEEANKSIQDFINKSYEKNINKLIVVTGKGIHSNNETNPYVSKDLSILKYSVPEFIKTNTELMSIIKKIEDQTNNKNVGYFSIYLKLKNKL